MGVTHFWKREADFIFCGTTKKSVRLSYSHQMTVSPPPRAARTLDEIQRKNIAFRHLLFISYSIYYCHIHGKKNSLLGHSSVIFLHLIFFLCCISEISALQCIAFFTPFINLIIMGQLMLAFEGNEWVLKFLCK